jgi:hypothetical protein
MSRQFTLLGNLIIVTALASVFSLFTLWLLDSWVKYPLFLFEILTIILLYLIINDYEVNVRINLSSNLRLNWGLVIDSLLLSFSSILLILCFTNTDVGVLRAALALLCTSLLPGYALLNISGLRKYFSRIEGLVLSYLLSYIYTGLVVLVLLPVSGGFRATVILISYIGLGMASIMKHINQPTPSTQKSLSRGIDLFALILSMGFYTLSFIFVYPGLALLPGTDISRHYASSVVLWRTPELYWPYGYFLAHLHEAAFVNLSNAPITIVQTALILLNLMMPLAFYMMAKNYAESVDARLPALSTVFYSTFSGLAWIYLTKLKLEGGIGPEMAILSIVNSKAYNTAMYFSQPFLWYVPISVSFIIFMTLLILLIKLNIEKKRFILLSSIFLISSFLIHITEMLIFIIFLCIYAFSSVNENLRINDALLSSIIGLTFIGIFFLVFKKIYGWVFFSTMYIIILLIVVFSVHIYVKSEFHRRLAHYFINFISGKIKIFSYIAVFVYVIAIITWIAVAPSFQLWAVYSIGFVPWFYYPVIFGIIGFLAILSLQYFGEEGIRGYFSVFAVLSIFSIIFGRILSYVNLNLFWSGYQEGRLCAYSFLAFAVLAPLVIIKTLDEIQVRFKNKVKKSIFSLSLIGMIVFYGCQSMFMSIEYWQLHTSSYLLDPKEKEAIDFMQKLYDEDNYSWGLVLSSSSKSMLTFAAPPWIESTSQVYLTAKNPEIPLTVLRASPPVNPAKTTHPYIYVHNRDVQLLKQYEDCWMNSHLLKIIPLIYSNDMVKVYNMSTGSFPQMNSKAALVIPYDNKLDPYKRWLYAYDVLSLGQYCYTTAFDLDPAIITYPIVILSFDPPTSNITHLKFEENFDYPDETDISTRWRKALISDTYGHLVSTDSFRVSEGRLIAGLPDKHEFGALLTGISASEFKVEMDTQLLSFNKEIQNSPMIIYAYRDPNNYRAFVINYLRGYIYIYFAKVVQGKGYALPQWPGFNTGVKYEEGITVKISGEVINNTHSMTLYVQDKSFTISMMDRPDIGMIGIATYNAYAQTFDNFKIDAINICKFRGYTDYLNYVERGGKLIILNTNGYGFFAESMLRKENVTFEAEKLSGSFSVPLPSKVSVQKFSTSSQDIEELAYYALDQERSVYIASKNFGLGEIIYINIYPILQRLDYIIERGDGSTYYGVLASLLKPLSGVLEKLNYESQPQVAAMFKQLKMYGETSINTSSVLFPLSISIEKLEGKYSNGTGFLFTNITDLKALNYLHAYIKASNLTIENGSGFYAKIVLIGPFSIEFEEGADLMLHEGDGDIKRIQNVNKLMFSNNETLSIHVRTPYIEHKGIISIKEFYSSGEIYSKTMAYGQDANVHGVAKLKLYLSDTYTWLNMLEILGIIERIPPIVAYDELSSLPSTLLFSFSLIPLICLIILVQHHKKES